MRYFFAILLIAASLIHPLVHSGDDARICPCAHGAIEGVAAQIAAAVALLVLLTARGSFWDGEGDFGSIPGRAPPATA